MPMAFHFAARSDIGLVRLNNQDSGYAGPHLIVVADGMGGHAGGDVASATVIAELFDLDDDAHGGFENTEFLTEAIRTANEEIARQAAEDPRLRGMGTTVTAILRSRDKLALAHIGDSRAYLLRDGRLRLITKDHSFVQSLVDEGRITEDEAANHPQRSLVTRVLTGSERDEPDLTIRHAQFGDRYLLCSDGLSGFVARETIEEVLTAHESPETTADRLVDLALRAGGPDNITVIIADVVDVTEVSPPTQPQVVGAAALRRRNGIKATAVTPAAKAAALSKAARKARDGGDGQDDLDDDLDLTAVQLADEGARSARHRRWRLIAAGLLSAILVVGLGYAAWGWSQKQYYIGEYEGNVAIYQGIPYRIGPVELSHADTLTGISVDDLPDFHRQRVAATLSFATIDDARTRLEELRAAAAECLTMREQGRACGTGPITPPTTQPTSVPTSPTTTSPSPIATTVPTPAATS